MKVLELGCGSQPAPELGGLIFRDEDLEYTGVDIELPPSLRDDEGKRFIQADITSMPFFEDDAFDLLLMRNFFGQFCDYLYPNLSRAEIIIRRGVREAHRVLRPLGHLAVVEENTPMDDEYVIDELGRAGFRETEHASMKYGVDNIGTDNPWRQLRSRYYGDVPVQTEPDDWLGVPYVLVVTK